MMGVSNHVRCQGSHLWPCKISKKIVKRGKCSEGVWGRHLKKKIGIHVQEQSVFLGVIHLSL